MTVGQRIARKRKELGLSQEALGEQLGVSRQAIYKWESDATLPEVEKLVALSRIFSVPVGWLLGVEEEPGAEAAPTGELTPEQLHMVEEIVARYLAARPEPEPVKRRRWPIVLAAVAAVALAVALISLFSRLDRVTADYQSLQNAIGRMDATVGNQIGSITSQVEEILKSQNQLTASYETRISAYDLAENTVTFAVTVTPKTYVEGMTAVLSADSGGGTAETEAALRDGQTFSGEITCPLTDDITLTAVFLTGGKRETQVLDRYEYLHSDSFPYAYVEGVLWFAEEDGVLVPDEVRATVEDGVKEPFDARAEEVRVGLFRDKKLVCWYEQTERLILVDGQEQMVTSYVRSQSVTLEPGHAYCLAVVVTDQYGRQRVYGDTPLVYDEGQGSWEPGNGYADAGGGWEF